MANAIKLISRGNVLTQAQTDDKQICLSSSGDDAAQDLTDVKTALAIGASDLLITASTDIGAALADGDEIVLYDLSATANRKSALSRVKTYIQALTDTLYVALSGNQTVAGNKTLSGNLVTTAKVSNTKVDITLAAAADTFAVTNNFVKVTGDAGANTVATITGGVSGQILTLLFVDGLVTITDTDAATADTINLSAAFTSSANDTLTLVYDGVKWLEVARSVN